MSDNKAFVSEPGTSHQDGGDFSAQPPKVKITDDTTQTIGLDRVDTEVFEDGEDYCCLTCFSWTKMCETLGNRQGRFISTLRPLRAPLVFALQALKRFELELERSIKSKDSAEDTSRKVMDVVDAINGLTTHTKLNIPPDENQMLRAVANELVILQRVIDEVAFTLRKTPSRTQSKNSSTHTTETTKLDSNNSTFRQDTKSPAFAQYRPAVPTAFENEPKEEANFGGALRVGSPLGGFSVKAGPFLDYTNPEIDANLVTTVTRTYDEHSLKERISRNCDRIENLICFIDQKCERRWWLKDLINFFQLFIKLALFVSASVSVVYHDIIVPSVITLVIAVIQGVIELLDQYFIKNRKPEDVKLSVFTGTVKSQSVAFAY